MRKKIILFLLILFTSFGVSVWSQVQKMKFTIKDMLSINVPSQIDISPDGKFVVFVLSKADFEESKYRTDLYIVSTETGEVKQLTFSKEDERMPKFSPDGKIIAFLSDRKAAGDEKEVKTQIWLLPIDGGEAYKLTNAPEGVISFNWMPDGKSILYLTQETLPKPEKEKKERDKKLKFDPTVVDKEKYRKEFYLVDVKSKKERKVFVGDYGVSEFDISLDGKFVVYNTNYTGDIDDGKKFDLWIFEVESGKARQLTTRPGGERQPKWSPDGRFIACVADLDPKFTYSQEELFIVNPQTGEMKNLTEKFDLGIVGYEFSKSQPEKIYARTASGVYTHVYLISAVNGEVKEFLGGEKVYGDMAISNNDGAIALLLEDKASAPDVFIFKNGELKKLTNLNPQLENFTFGEQTVIKWKSFDGWVIEGILVKPVNFEPGKKYPMLVAVHGGPYGRIQNILRQYYNLQVWANEGYLVFAPNFRGSSGYSNKFGISNFKDLGGGDFKDIMAGIDYIIKELKIADENKIGIFGGSYGGYMTNWAITQTDRFKAAVSMFGIFNLITDYSNSYLPSWEPDYLGDYYWNNLKIYLERSPFYYVKNIKTPVLIMHGDEDPNTFISNSKEMYQALKHLGKTVEFVRYPREGHGFREPNHRIDEFYRCLDWFNKYLLGIEPEKKAIVRIDEWVNSDGWSVKVVRANKNVNYAGFDTSEKFIEVEILFKANEEAKPFDISVNDFTVFDPEGNKIYPSGFPVEVSGVKAILSGDFKINVSTKGENKYYPLKLSFKVSNLKDKLKLKIAKFPQFDFFLD
ncbi:alpha/beta hydrolase family protein [Candidatus Chrysopegis kryptomonas]|uniref:Dipeptidyl aminopeptidase/acylaminoacyl peptidase n=1 Tax=Candidatus Chryseopegocella kryptomonas TaxID=1633643 RepID=A0A0P1MW08_9BACT|nr:S9 family peptidase [Candidatus Chrysopegis kryptomonas]CUT00101.1 Dipeptidyl aminopeptidase/acylaminoacyl peptidase [Candidatus Chrysopegis kryptomonas]